MPTPKLGPAQQDEARKLFADGAKVRALATRFGVTPPTIERVLRGPGVSDFVMRVDSAPIDDVNARLAEIPSDTRTLTARVCGDPLFERSALYRKQQQEKAR